MSFELFYATTAPEPVAVYDGVYKALEEWRKDCHQLVQSWGFDGSRAYDFGGPLELLMPCPKGCYDRKGPEIDGFKGGDATIVDDHRVFSYTLNKRHAGYKERAAACKAIADKHMPVEFTDGGLSLHRSFRRLVCHRLGLSVEVFGGNRISFSTCWKFNCGTLLVQLPVGKDDDGEYHAPTPLPVGWQELTTSQTIELFDGHNRRLAEKKATGV